jgi:hypothetical protein
VNETDGAGEAERQLRTIPFDAIDVGTGGDGCLKRRPWRLNRVGESIHLELNLIVRSMRYARDDVEMRSGTGRTALQPHDVQFVRRMKPMEPDQTFSIEAIEASKIWN